MEMINAPLKSVLHRVHQRLSFSLLFCSIYAACVTLAKSAHMCVWWLNLNVARRRAAAFFFRSLRWFMPILKMSAAPGSGTTVLQRIYTGGKQCKLFVPFRLLHKRLPSLSRTREWYWLCFFSFVPRKKTLCEKALFLFALHFYCCWLRFFFVQSC
jgi:hypothetical protein